MPYNCLEHCKEEIYQKQHIDVDTKPPIVGGARARLARAALARPHPPMHQQPANLVRAGEGVLSLYCCFRLDVIHRSANSSS